MMNSNKVLSGIGAKGVVHSVASVGTLDIKAEKKPKEYVVCEKTGFIYGPRSIMDKYEKTHIISYDLMSS